MPRTRQPLTDPALAAVRDADDRVRQAEVAKLVAVLDWASAHEVTEAVAAANTDTPGLQLGGPGCPWVSEYDAWDLSCVLQFSADSCVRYLGNALELRHRLPRLWQRVLDLDVPVWRAFKIAEQTQCLPIGGATQVDRALAHRAHSVSFAQVERTIATALAEFCPDEAQRRRDKAAEHRRFDVGLHDAMLLEGTAEVRGCLDLADALDLEAAVSHTARQLADLGSTESDDVRRARAVGEIARAQLALDLEAGQEASSPGRAVTIVAHVDGTDVAQVDNAQTPVLVEQLLAWCAAAGTAVTIKPIIDLNANLTSESYVPGVALAEQVDLRDRRCVFPFCTRRRTDRDHLHPYDDGGMTESHNLARLCRGHHRAKTFSRWSYDMPAPGVYVWHSPAGATLVVDRTAEP